MASITEVKAAITGQSRANRFEVLIPSPEGVLNGILVKGASMPGKTVTPLEVPYRGLKYKVAGDPTFNDWTVTVLGEDYSVYEQLHKWFDKASNFSTNERGNPGDYKIDGITVQQLDNRNNVIATMTLNGVWVTAIDDVAFSQDSVDTLVEFGATFSIDSTEFSR